MYLKGFGACFSTVTYIEGQSHPLYLLGALQWLVYSEWNHFDLGPPRSTFGRQGTPVFVTLVMASSFFSRLVPPF